MTRARIVPALICALGLGACDDGPSFTVTAEAAGANCPTGGFRIEADSQTFYSCNGQATTEEIAEGAEGNPCFGPALRITIPTADGTRYAYVCQPVAVDQTSEDAITAQLRIMLAAGEIECACAEDPDAQAECAQYLDLYEAILRVNQRCLPDVLAVVGPIPESERAALECSMGVLNSAIDCLDAIDANECSMEVEEQAMVCFEMFGDMGECPLTTEAYEAWQSQVADFGEFLGCATGGGAPI